MFNKSKYTTWYFNLIYSRKIRILDANYYEKHHIIPKSLGGSDEPTNLVRLTAREHFLAHWLLTKMCVDGKHKRKMSNALNKMRRNNSRRRNVIWSKWQYEIMRKAASDAQKGKTFSKQHRQRLSESLKGIKKTEEQIEKQRRSLIESGNAAGANNGMYGKKQTQQTKDKIGAKIKGTKCWINNNSTSKLVNSPTVLENGWNYGRYFSDEHKAKISAAKLT